MSNPNMESKIKELMELKRMKEEIEAEIAAAEDEIKGVMGDEETLLAGAFKVDWKTVVSSRIDTAALKKMMPEIAERFMKQTMTRRFCVR
ncbi:MAG: hypothetical protein IJ418_04455 [Clostridia bacterium]|nr:hypothetical protein [Clostridia bacterium]